MVKSSRFSYCSRKLRIFKIPCVSIVGQRFSRIFSPQEGIFLRGIIIRSRIILQRLFRGITFGIYFLTFIIKLPFYRKMFQLCKYDDLICFTKSLLNKKKKCNLSTLKYNPNKTLRMKLVSHSNLLKSENRETTV